MDVVSCGYGGEATAYPPLLTANTTTAETGDEPVLAARRIGVPVAVSPIRSNAVKAILAQHDVQIIATDDEPQHRRLARDVEIVVIDDGCRFGNGWWLPADLMRERTGRLKSVNATTANGGIAQPGEILVRLKPGLTINLRTGERRDVAQLSNIVAMASIGHLPRFFATLKACGASAQKSIVLTDRQSPICSDVSVFIDAGQMLVTAEEDAAKCRALVDENW